MMPRLTPQDIDFPQDPPCDPLREQWMLFCRDQPHLSKVVQSRGWYSPAVFRGFLLGYCAVRAAISRRE
jgi:hypothetical protein